MKRPVYPFAAIVGKDSAKTALLMHAVHPGLGGVLVSGTSGTAKTALIRGLAELMPDQRLVEVPLGITEDRLLGAIDISKMTISGSKRLQKGLLVKANENLLHADNINLLPSMLIHSIIESAKTGRLYIEREGVSFLLPTRFRLLASMNPEEGKLQEGCLDWFGLYIGVDNENGLSERKEIIRRQLAYEQDPRRFAASFSEQTEQLRQRIRTAQLLLSKVQPTVQIFELASYVAEEAGCEGHRAEYYLIQCARALAAWADRTEIRNEDIRQAAEWVLPHRMKTFSESSKQREQDRNREEPQSNESRDDREASGEPKQQSVSANESSEASEADSGTVDNSSALQNSKKGPSAKRNAETLLPESVQSIGRTFAARAIEFREKKKLVRSGPGKRNLTRSGTKQGRYVRFITPKGKITDLALDATLRAAAPYQHIRKNNGMSVVIESGDLRQKVRDNRTGTTMQFVVDASGSMAARKRMEAVKGAILSMLLDAYQKRDRIGMVAFRRGKADVVLQLTRSVDLAAQQLSVLPTGGKTPLTLGIMRGWEVLDAARRKDKELIPVMIVITDGKANEGVKTGQSVQQIMDECLRTGRAFRESGIHALVLDTEQGYIRLGYAAKLANAMGAAYYKLEELDEKAVVAAVRQMIK
ncbi:magnesium chelatase [Paenibacillus sp. PK3_47]|uniref:VWA domain-containing protein n=1 Tax=Paenibacillus sp. PK3_47 TaxID=2072642 RepID=UPI00201E6D25|nr:VWA domain-containing protein [Paenibacillus sp. PK3_47]UQZ37005.1 magnesium chelatase [Paenibacillus sp. PK3_47]